MRRNKACRQHRTLAVEHRRQPDGERTLINHSQGKTVQVGQINANTVVNDGLWSVSGQRALTTPALTGSGAFDLTTTSDILTIDQSGNSTFVGSFGGAGAMVKAGTGTLTLNGASSHVGGTSVLAGTLDTTGGGTLADNGAVAVGTGATFKAGTADTVGAVTNAGVFIVAANQHGASLANAGTTQLAANLTSAGIVTNDGTLTVSASHQMTTAGLNGGETGVLRLDQATDVLTLNQSHNSAFSGQIAGAGTLIKTGAGTLTLDSAMSSVNIGGELVINQGTLALDGGYILHESMDVVVNSATIAGQQIVGTLQLIKGDQSIFSLSGAGQIDLGTTNRLTVQNGGNFSGKVLGSGALSIRSGSFQLDDDLISLDPTSVFDLGGEDSQASTTVGARSPASLRACRKPMATKPCSTSAPATSLAWAAAATVLSPATLRVTATMAPCWMR